MEGYWCYWHGGKGYSGVGLHVSKTLAPERPAFAHPAFDYENRIVTVDLGTDVGDLTVASIYVPNGGKDFPAKMRFLEALDGYAAIVPGGGPRARDLRRLNVARTDRDVHPKERKPRAIGQLPEERALLERIIGRGLVDVGRALDPDNDGLFTWWAPWRNMRAAQHRVAPRLRARQRGARARARRRVPVQKDVGTSDHAPVVATFE